MEPRIGFCTTADGVRIAYATKGDGFPVVRIPAWASHVEIAIFPDNMGPFRGVTYDKRGTGLSDRHLGDYSIETRLLDLEAVVAELELDRFAINGFSEGTPVAIAYTAAHPERVSRLILNGGFAVGDTTDDERATRAAVTSLIRANWGMGSAALTSVFFDNPVGPDEYWHRIQREGVAADDAANMWEANGLVDLRHLLPRITCPTLVIHGRNDRAVPFERARELMAGIPGARLVSDDGGHVGGDVRARAIAELKFLLEDEHVAGAPTPIVADASSGSMAVILFADIADSTGITERIGDAAFHVMSEGLHRALREALAAAGGRVVEGRVLGDGVMAVFDAAKGAIAAAGACHVAADASELRLHVGIHAGDVIRDANDAHGGAVNMAARVAAASAAGETLVSDVVRALGRTSAGVVFEDRGEFVLKGIEEGQRLWKVVGGRE